MRAAFNSRADSDPPCPQIVKASEEFEAELVTNDKHNELINDGELEELDSGLKPSASELPAAINLYRVIRAGGKCNPPGITDDVCEPGTGTKCLPVPEQGIKRCIKPASRIPAGGACTAGDVCVDRYNCIGGMCVIRYNGYCSVGDICEIGYTCVDGKCGTGSTSVICGVNSADCASGYICCGGDCVIAPTGTCSVNCICYNNDCGACNANCNCFGKCYMPNCGTNCNYNGGASYCSPGLAVTEKNEGGFIVEG